ncbi:MAG: ATP-binding protein [Cyanobacteria bacterium P01_F01_bin.86]
MTPNQFLKIAQVLPEPMLLVTNTGEILAVNRAAVKLLARKSQELVGQYLTAFVTDTSERVIDYLRICSQNRQMMLGALTIRQGPETKILCRSQGAVIQPRSPDTPAIILLRLERREGSKFVALNQKIHELSKEIQQRQRTQLELSKSNENLKLTLLKLQTALDVVQTEKMIGLGQLAAGIAHEINNPISFIYGNIKYASYYFQDLLDLIHLYQQTYPDPSPAVKAKIAELDLDFLEEDIEKLLQSLQIGSDRVAEIVKSLRIFSRLDEAEFKKVDIHESLEATLMILKNRLNATNSKTRIEIIKNYSNLPFVYCSPGPLNQVFMSILNNAIDALEDVSQQCSQDLSQRLNRIWIWTEKLTEKTVGIHIKDNGDGIPADIQPRIFNPFFTTKPVGKGTGLGLSISYRIIESHGGQIHVKSAPDWGTQFSVELPIA